MISLMTSTLMAATVGLAISMSVSASKTTQRTMEEPVAISFVKYKKSVECWAAVNPGAQTTSLTPATLKATLDGVGVPCMHPSYVGATGFNVSVTATTVYTYTSPTTIRGMAIPVHEILWKLGPNPRGGVVLPSGTQVRNIEGNVFANDLALPPGSVVVMTPR